MRLPKSAEAFPEYAMWLQGQDRSLDCIRGYLNVLRLWRRWCDENDIDHVQASQGDIARWLVGRRYLEEATVRNNVVALRSYYRWAVETGLRRENPMRHIKPPRVRLKPVAPYSREDLRRLLASARSRRDRTLLLLLLGSGLRSCEIVGIREEDIDWQAGTIRVFGKGRKWRLVAPGDVVMRTLRDYVAHRSSIIWQDEMSLSTTHGLRSWFRRLSDRAGIPKAVLHRFRHTFATEFIKAGGSEGELMNILGQSQVTMAFHYSQSVRVEMALKAQRRLSPAEAWAEEALTTEGEQEEENDTFPRIVGPSGYPDTPEPAEYAPEPLPGMRGSRLQASFRH